MRRGRTLLPLALLLALAACAEPDGDDNDAAPAAPPTVVIADSTQPDSVSAAVDAGPPTVLLAFEVFAERATLEPIALILPTGKLANPPHDQTAAHGRDFEHEYYDPGTMYVASRGGGAVGAIEVIAPELAGCTGMPASAWLRLEDRPDDAPAVDRGIATAFDPGDNSFLVPSTGAEDSIVRATAHALLRGHGVPDAFLPDISWDSTAVLVGAPGGRIVIGGATVLVDTMQERSASLFFVMETGDSAMTTTLEAFNVSTVDRSSRSSFFDAFDPDRDGTPEMIVRTLYFESWDYTIYRRGPPWQAIYRGGGGGC